MKKFIVLLGAVWAMTSLSAQTSQRVNNLREVVIWGGRPMKDIGVQKTTFDSIALKENIALSMADILTFNSSVFVKSYGRATLSTVAFRGTSPSHTQVTWNGMRINNPMLGMTDFSTIPSYFIDQASLLHGTSSVNETGGGLGGLVKLGTLPEVAEGVNMQYVQGIGSFKTFDEFARFTYGSEHWHVSTRVVYSSSPNDYKYINHDKKINIYDEDKNIIGQYHPTERNKSGAYKDFHALQEVYYNTKKGNRFGLNLWYINSNRELPLLTTDYGDEHGFENRQREQTLRSVLSWDHRGDGWKVDVKGGYIYTWMAYDYKREVAENNWSAMTRSRSHVNTFYGQVESEFNPTRRWYFTANLSAHQQFVRSADKNILLQDGDKAIVGYDKGRIELSGSASAKWKPIDPIGMSLVVREEMFGNTWAPIIPAFFIDGLLSREGNVMLKASVSRNHKFPTLNDLYFMPGGNPNLKSEHGWTYDAGASFDIGWQEPFPVSMGGSVTWFDSRIDDWIIWLPTTKGFFSPRNVKKVHAYGIEGKLNIAFELFKGWLFDLNGSYSWTPSINEGEKMSAA
ncbi:MAG: TonB-dependent receptor, partial [Muribaculaceae bacterium]|nr:TonB-dependent receptor [Muribaculaceae bacterium]